MGKIVNTNNAGLTPKQAEWVRCYTDPTLPSYLNAKGAARLAGCGKTAGGDMVKNEKVMLEVERIFGMRQEQGRDVLDMLHDARMQAVTNLIDSVKDIRDLRIINPEVEFGPGAVNVATPLLTESGDPIVDRYGNPVLHDQSARFREINKHNANVLKLRQEARLGAMDLLAYIVGKPEQVIKHKSEAVPTPDKVSELSDEELEELMKVVQRRLAKEVKYIGEVVDAEIIGESEGQEQSD